MTYKVGQIKTRTRTLRLKRRSERGEAEAWDPSHRANNRPFNEDNHVRVKRSRCMRWVLIALTKSHTNKLLSRCAPKNSEVYL